MKRVSLILIILLLAIPCQARTITVGDDGIADFNNIQAAINDANDGDIIEVQPGAYTGDGNRDIDFLGKAITVRSIDPNDPDIVAATIIDCNGTEAEPHRGFVFVNNEDANSLLSGLTITNGFGPKEQDIYTVTSRGGAILCNYSSPTIAHCIIRNNSASSWGGGIYIIDSSPFITDCTFIENSSGEPNIYGGWGGAIFCRRSSPTLTNCIFIGNQAKKAGGALYETGSSKSIVTNCTFSNNSASEGRGGAINIRGRMVLSDCTFNANSSGTFGGALCCDEYSNPMITSCTFTANSAKIGGGIYCEHDSAIINNCLVIGNSAANASYQSRGGGISCEHSSAVIKNCLIANNYAEYGGGVCFYYSNAELGHCTITNNSATASGDGICCFGDSRPQMTPQISNCIIWGNSGSGGSDISNNIAEVSYCNVEGGYSGTGNINVNPRFVNPVAGDYHLSAGSPCINAGNPSFFPLLGLVDIDDEPRMMGEHVDMGVDEFTDSSPIIEIAPAEFQFDAKLDGANPEAQVLRVRNIGTGTINWEVVENCPWLYVMPTTGDSSGEIDEITVGVDISGLNANSYECTLAVSSPEALNSPQMINVYLTIQGPEIELSPTHLEFYAVKGQPNPANQSLDVSNIGGGTLVWDISHDCNWLQVEPNHGSTPSGQTDVVSLSVDTVDIIGGIHNCDVVISDPCAENSPQIVSVTLYLYDDDGTLYVPSEYPTIQAAINAAQDGDMAIVADGLYTGLGNRDIDFKGKAITVRSENGAANCIIDCQGSQSEPHRGFNFHSGEGPSSVVRGFTVTSGYTTSSFLSGGGAIECIDASPTIANCIFRGNYAIVGGGAIHFAFFASPEIINCTFHGNVAGFRGGAVSTDSCVAATLRNCIIWGNIPADGPGVYVGLCGDFSAAAPVNIYYSLLQAPWQYGENNIVADPCFAEPNSGDYHLKSQAGRWHSNSETWVADANTSVAIDAGDPASPIGYEPFPNGGIINMGAYGGTAEASKSYFGTTPCETIVAGDINGDCKVNFLDFRLMALHWLEDNTP